MFMLAFHIVAIGLLVVAVWGVAYGRGRRAGERQLRRRLGLGPEAGAEPYDESQPSI